MKYLKLNLQYLFVFDKGRRFLLLALLCLPVAIVGAISAPTSQFFGWFAAYPGGYRNYLQLVAQMFAHFNWGLFILFLVMAALTVSVVVSLNYRTLRTGKMNLRQPLRLLNENLIPSMIFVLCSVIVMVVWLGLAVLFIFLFHYIKAMILGQILSIVFMALWIVALIAFFSTFVLWLPIMSHNGIRSMRALSYAVEKTGSVWYRVVTAVLPVAAIFVAGSVGIWFTGSVAAGIAVDALLYDIMFVYMLTLPEIVFFEVTGMPREDIPRGYRLRRYN